MRQGYLHNFSAQALHGSNCIPDCLLHLMLYACDEVLLRYANPQPAHITSNLQAVLRHRNIHGRCIQRIIPCHVLEEHGSISRAARQNPHAVQR